MRRPYSPVPAGLGGLLLLAGLSGCTSPNPELDGGSDTSDLCPEGSEACPCIPDLSCDEGLMCTDDGVCEPSSAICGDNVIEGSEQCDDGPDNGPNGACLDTCVQNVCGDGFQGPGEACDDGNDNNADACTSACELPACGDGFLQGTEQCDDGNDSSEDGCVEGCVEASCGDGFVRAGFEDCEDGNDDDRDGCSNSCFFTSFPSCGNDMDDEGEICFESAPALQLPGDGGHAQFFLADLNEDGLADLILKDPENGNALQYRIGAGDGSFGSALPVEQSGAPGFSTWAVHDLNGDEAPDIILVGADGVIYPRYGDPEEADYFAFEQPSAPLTEGPVSFLRFDDFDGDGRDDIGWTSGSRAGVILQPSPKVLGDGGLAVVSNFPFAIGSADLDGDGAAALIVHDNGPGTLHGYSHPPFESQFEIPEIPSSTGLVWASMGRPLDELAGDELVLVTYADENVPICESFEQEDCLRTVMSVYPGDPAAPDLDAAWNVPSPGLFVAGLEGEDMDGDADVDLIALDINGESINVHRNLGDGKLTSPIIVPITTNSLGDVLRLGDINGDGRPDVALGTIDANIRFLLSSD